MRFNGMLGALALAAVVSVSAAGAATMPPGGAIRIFVTPSPSGTGGTIIVAGAIGDYGHTSPVKKGIGEAILKKGTFDVNLSILQRRLNNAPPTLENRATCSFVFAATGPVMIADGTGLYKGIKGTATITESFAGIGPRYASGPKKGQCNMSNNANPIAQWASVTGVGAISFG
jgi:hypothetical protein